MACRAAGHLINVTSRANLEKSQITACGAARTPHDTTARNCRISAYQNQAFGVPRSPRISSAEPASFRSDVRSAAQNKDVIAAVHQVVRVEDIVIAAAGLAGQCGLRENLELVAWCISATRRSKSPRLIAIAAGRSPNGIVITPNGKDRVCDRFPRPQRQCPSDQPDHQQVILT